MVASAAHWIAGKRAPTGNRVCRRPGGHRKTCRSVRATRGRDRLRSSRKKRSGSPSLPALRTGSRASSLLQVTAFAADLAGTAKPVGAYEQREAAIGCAAVVKTLGSPSLPALRTGSRASALLQRTAFAADLAGTANPVGAYEQREAAIGCAAVVKMSDSPALPALRCRSSANGTPPGQLPRPSARIKSKNRAPGLLGISAGAGRRGISCRTPTIRASRLEPIPVGRCRAGAAFGTTYCG
jgi:hypothetical protein